MKKYLLIIALCMSYSLSFSQDITREYITTKTNEPPIIDGHIDDACWQAASVTSDFNMYQPYDDRSASFNTEFKILYDNNNIYIAVRAYDPEPSKIYKKLSRRDNVNEEAIAIYLDCYHNKTTAYYFAVNASGVIKDMFGSLDGKAWDESWNAIWMAKTNIDDKGWTAEFQIPLSQLRFINSEEQQWGLNVQRHVQRVDETSLWAHLSQDAEGFIHRFGILSGLKNIKARKILEISPYALSGLKTYKAETGNPYRDGSNINYNIGIDGKIGLSNNFTMDYTINPDFGQVEADPASVNLSAYETFFEEKRPFFMEGSNIYDFCLDVNGGSSKLFYSRRIGGRPHFNPELNSDEYADIPNASTILAASKITGRTDGGLSIGVLNAVTQKEYAKINTDGNISEYAIEPLSNYATVALGQELNQGNTKLGGIVTAVNRQLDETQLTDLHKQAYTAGVSLRHSDEAHRWRIDARTYASYVQGSTQAISNTQLSPSHLFQRPDAPWVNYDSTRTYLFGNGGSASIGQFSGKFQSSFKLSWRSPGLETNDIGYIGETDDITAYLWMRYRMTEPFSIFRAVYLSGSQWNVFNYGAMHTYSGFNIYTNYQFKNFMNCNISYTYYGEANSSSHLRGGPRLIIPSSWNLWGWLGSNSLNDLQGSIYIGSDGNKDGLKSSINISTNVSWKINDYFNVEFNLNWSQYNNAMQYVTQQEFENESHYILGLINRETFSTYLALNLNLTPNISLEYRLRPYFTSAKYDNFKRVVDGENKNINERLDIFSSDNLNYIEGQYFCDPNKDNQWDYSFSNPDFVYNSLQSNLVFRWEYFPGSTVYIIWSLNNSVGSSDNKLVLAENIQALQDEIPENIFLIKVSYRLGR